MSIVCHWPSFAIHFIVYTHTLAASCCSYLLCEILFIVPNIQHIIHFIDHSLHIPFLLELQKRQYSMGLCFFFSIEKNISYLKM